MSDMNEKQTKGSRNAETWYMPFLMEIQQSTNSKVSIRRYYIKQRTSGVDCGIGDPPDALEWHEPAMVGFLKKRVCRK